MKLEREKFTKLDVFYTVAEGNKRERCALCQFMTEEDRCLFVQGYVQDWGKCVIFVKNERKTN